MPAEPWLDELSEDWGDPEDIGLHLESLRTPRKHMGDIDGLGHRKSMSVPVEDRPMTSPTRSSERSPPPRRGRARGFTTDGNGRDRERWEGNIFRNETRNETRHETRNDDDNDNDNDDDDIGDSVIHYDENPDLDLDNCGTTQVKARKPTRANPDDEDFDFLPEWKRRLLRGDNPLAGGDLFSPIGLEKFFEPPAGKSVNAQIGDLSAKLKGLKLRVQEGEVERVVSGVGSGGEEDKGQGRETASSLEELRNEGFTPIPFDADGLHVKVENGGHDGPSLSRDNSNKQHGSRPEKTQTHLTVNGHSDDDDHSDFDLSQHSSFPEDLSVGGSPDTKISKARRRTNTRPGTTTDDDEGEGSRSPRPPKAKARTRPVTPAIPSPAHAHAHARTKSQVQTRTRENLHSPTTFVTNPKTRASPPGGNSSSSPSPTRRAQSDVPQPSPDMASSSNGGGGINGKGPSGGIPVGLQRRSEEIIRRPRLLSNLSQEEIIARPNSTPLKLFGDHDTFTNNKLLRRLSQLDRLGVGNGSRDGNGNGGAAGAAGAAGRRGSERGKDWEREEKGWKGPCASDTKAAQARKDETQPQPWKRGHVRGQSAPEHMRMHMHRAALANAAHGHGHGHGQRNRPNSRQSNVVEERENENEKEDGNGNELASRPLPPLPTPQPPPHRTRLTRARTALPAPALSPPPPSPVSSPERRSKSRDRLPARSHSRSRTRSRAGSKAGHVRPKTAMDSYTPTPTPTSARAHASTPVKEKLMKHHRRSDDGAISPRSPAIGVGGRASKIPGLALANVAGNAGVQGDAPRTPTTTSTPHEGKKGVESKRLLYSPAKASTPKRRRTSTAPGAEGRKGSKAKQASGLQWEWRWKRDSESEKEKPLIEDAVGRSREGSLKGDKGGIGKAGEEEGKGRNEAGIEDRTDNTATTASTPAMGPVMAAAENIDLTYEALRKRFGDKFHDDLSQVDMSRKGSITTSDFLCEATKVMNLIRAKGSMQQDENGTVNGLPSVLEDERDEDGDDEEEKEEEEVGDGEDDMSSPEAFSRPPSREGGGQNGRLSHVGGVKIPHSNDRTREYLRKYADDEEDHLELASSLNSLHLADEHTRVKALKRQQLVDKPLPLRPRSRNHKPGPASPVSAVKGRSPDDAIISDIPNVRIRSRLGNASATRNASDESLPLRSYASFNSQASGRSHASSVGAKGLIPSDKVAHLIPENVGVMVYDRGKQAWVKSDGDARNANGIEEVDPNSVQGVASAAGAAASRPASRPGSAAAAARLARKEQLPPQGQAGRHWNQGRAMAMSRRLGTRRSDSDRNLSDEEDDPFKDISDLSVDEAEEFDMIRVTGSGLSGPRSGRTSATQSNVSAGARRDTNATLSQQTSQAQATQATAAASGVSAHDDINGLGISFNSSTEPTKSISSRRLSSVPQPETRETSWGSDMLGTSTRKPDGPPYPGYAPAALASECGTDVSSKYTNFANQSRSSGGSRATTAISSVNDEAKRGGGGGGGGDEATCTIGGDPAHGQAEKHGTNDDSTSLAQSRSSHPDKQARVVTITFPSVPPSQQARKYRDRDADKETLPEAEELAAAEEMMQEWVNANDARDSEMNVNVKATPQGKQNGRDKEGRHPAPPATGDAASATTTTTTTPNKALNPRTNLLHRPPSFKRRDFKGRPISRIEEERSAEESMLLQGNELSIVPMGHNYADFSVHQPKSAVPSPAPNDKSYSFHLNTLPEFTLHQTDEQETQLSTVRREVSFVGRRMQPSSLKQIHGRFSLTSEQLVRGITEVEENELDWECLRSLNLANKSLVGTNKLDQLCPRLEELDLSQNHLSQLTGVPQSVRSLRLRWNCLSELTAWGHLTNLQYLDVSNNELESLDAFSGLVHLRGLKANNNRITRLGGITKLDGLLSLSLKGNDLVEVDFARTAWKRLTSLDLGQNQLQKISNADTLSSLEELDLRENDLVTFGADTALPRLRTLKISYNALTHLDTLCLPELRVLYADGNHLQTVYGLAHCRRLEALSIREQILPEVEDEVPLTVDFDVSLVPGLRKLYLSGNRLGKHILRPKKPVPGLQFLDIASCALETLPSQMGQKFMNLRALNANYNALSDFTGLVGISRLVRLLVAGNRISGLRGICQILKEVGGRHGALRYVDLRGNPITVGFYPVATAGMHTTDVTFHRKSGAYKPVTADSDGKRMKDPYTLPPIDSASDAHYVNRLDDGTRTRRRVVHCLINVSAGSRLKLLDGLDVSNMDPIGLLEDSKQRRGGENDVWRRLVELGVVRKSSSGDSTISGMTTDATGSNETLPTAN